MNNEALSWSHIAHRFGFWKKNRSCSRVCVCLISASCHRELVAAWRRAREPALSWKPPMGGRWNYHLLFCTTRAWWQARDLLALIVSGSTPDGGRYKYLNCDTSVIAHCEIVVLARLYEKNQCEIRLIFTLIGFKRVFQTRRVRARFG